MVIDFVIEAYINIIGYDIFYFLFSMIFLVSIVYSFYKIST